MWIDDAGGEVWGGVCSVRRIETPWHLGRWVEKNISLTTKSLAVVCDDGEMRVTG